MTQTILGIVIFKFCDHLNFREDSYFTKNPEHVLLKIEHSVVAFSSFKDPYAASHRMMNGWLVSSDGKIMKQLSDPL